jgi:hypothetical protein
MTLPNWMIKELEKKEKLKRQQEENNRPRVYIEEDIHREKEDEYRRMG